MEGMFFRDRNEERLLESTELFTMDEIRNLVASRKNFEYKIHKNDKNAYIACIDQEIKLFNKIKSRAHKRNTDLHKQIAIRIVKLHTVALSHYKDDLKLWLSYIKFCMQAEFDTLLSDAFAQMLSCHTDKHLWLLAAKWEMDECKNIEKALTYLHRGLYHHPKASAIFTELCKLELNAPNYACDKLHFKKRLEESELKVMKLCDLAQKELPADTDLYVAILKIATEHKCTVRLQNMLTVYIANTFPHNEDVWCCLAQRELNGHHLTDEQTYEFVQATGSRVQNLIGTFQQAVRLVPSETMWTKYLNALIDLCEAKYNVDDRLQNAFMVACEQAHCANLLSEEHYLIWLKRLQDGPRLLNILQEATRAKPTYYQLWSARVRYHMARGQDTEIDRIFEQAVAILQDDSVQIWRMKIQYHQLKSSDRVEAVYREALNYSPTVSMHLKPQFLDWLVLFKSVEVVRKEYECLALQEPWCFELHKKMVELEAMCPEPSEEHLEIVSRVATQQFGEEWMDYVKDEINCGLNWRKPVYLKLKYHENK